MNTLNLFMQNPLEIYNKLDTNRIIKIVQKHGFDQTMRVLERALTRLTKPEANLVLFWVKQDLIEEYS